MTKKLDQNNESPKSGQRLDKWLWFARVVKTRTMATKLVAGGKVRVNREKIDKPSQTVCADDVLTININRRIRILKILAPGTRRGPADEAQALYEDLTPEEETPAPAKGLVTPVPAARREPGRGRPTKRERREIDQFRGRSR
ncbi:MAG: RNA-binding S4 domain-containing protein [Hyphomicrobiaceae bacterium]